jgi:hypothetical protein
MQQGKVFVTFATDSNPARRQLILRSETRYFSKGSIIADYREDSKGLMVITAGKVEILMNHCIT